MIGKNPGWISWWTVAPVVKMGSVGRELRRGSNFHLRAAELQLSVGQPDIDLYEAGGRIDLELWPGERFI